MDDKEKNISPEQPNEAPRNPKEDIPLWLQGLEEETKANRLKAEMAGNIEPIEEETVQDSFPKEAPFEELESLATLSEETRFPEEDLIPTEGDLEDALESEAEENESESIEIDSLVEEETSQETFPPSLEYSSPDSPMPTVADEQEEQYPPMEEAAQDVFPTESSFEIVEHSETPPDEILETEMGSISPKETFRDASPVEAESDLSDLAEAFIESSKAEEDSQNEEILTQPLSEQTEEPDDLEWVRQIPEPTDEPLEEEKEHTKPQNFFEEPYPDADDEFERTDSEQSSSAESNQFIDISEATFENDQIVPSEEEGISRVEEESSGWYEEEDTQQVKGKPFGESGFAPESDQPAVMEDKIIPDDEGLVFINDEITSYDNFDQFSNEELLPDDEDLPKWLQRLIADSYPDDESEEYADFDYGNWEEITKPVKVPASDTLLEEQELTEELDQVEEAEDFDLISELEELEPGDFIETLEDNQPLLEIEEESLIEDTSPVQINAEDLETVKEQEPIEWTEEDNLYFNPENGYVIEIPEPLQFARQVLLHGEVSQALEILNKYIAEGSYLDEIHLWLSETADSSKNHKSEIWESLGDIAASQNNHKEALSAYSKAINLLLVNKDANGTC